MSRGGYSFWQSVVSEGVHTNYVSCFLRPNWNEGTRMRNNPYVHLLEHVFPPLDLAFPGLPTAPTTLPSALPSCHPPFQLALLALILQGTDQSVFGLAVYGHQRSGDPEEVKKGLQLYCTKSKLLSSSQKVVKKTAPRFQVQLSTIRIQLRHVQFTGNAAPSPEPEGGPLTRDARVVWWGVHARSEGRGEEKKKNWQTVAQSLGSLFAGIRRGGMV